MHEIIDLVVSYLRGMWRFRWYVYVAAWPIAIAGWVFVEQMPDQFQATSRVHVDTDSMLRPLLRGLAAPSNVNSQLKLINKTLFSRPNLEKIVRMTDMDLNVENDEDMNAIINRLKSRISFSSERRSANLYNISYVDEDPILAKQVIQSFQTVFMENTLGDKRKDTDSAQKFLNERIVEYEQLLDEADERLKQFKIKNIGLMGASGGGFYSRLQGAIEDLKSVELELRESTQRRDELESQLEDTEDGESGFDFGMLTEYRTVSDPAIDARIQNLQSKLDELLLGYTEFHPDVIMARKTIKTLEVQKLATTKSVAEVSTASSFALNPVQQQTKIALGEANAIVASLSVRAEEFAKRVRDLKQKVDTVPEIEAQLKRLDRDYSVNKENYNILLARRESAQMAERVEQSSDSIQFRVIDPPFVEPQPFAPNRPLLITVVFVGAMVMGLAFILFLSQIRPTIDGINRLRELTGLAVLGGVTMIRTKEQELRRRIEVASFAATGSLLVVAYVGVLSLVESDTALIQLLKNL